MKTLVFFLAVVAVASAQLNQSPSASQGHTGGAHNVPVVAGHGARSFQPYKPVNYGPKVYGHGALNSLALPPHPFLMQRALAIVNQIPGSLIRLDLNGEITLTDRYGEELEAIGPYGQEIDLDF